jgi:hypothetical protein
MNPHLGIRVAILIAIFFSCNKPASDFPLAPSNAELIQKINQYLDFQKTIVKQIKVQNIIDLQKVLDFARLESSPGSTFTLVHIPILRSYLTDHQLDPKLTVSFVAKLDQSGKVLNANILLFKPDPNSSASLSAALLAKVSAAQPATVDGQFKVLSVAGRWISDVQYKGGNPYSVGTIMSGREVRQDSRKQVADGCTDWYLVTTYHYADGSSSTTEEYVGTTCDCGDPTAESLCPDDGGGDGSTSNDDDCIATQTSNFNQESSNGATAADVLSISTGDIDNLDKYKNPSWVCFKGFGGWSLISYENGTVHLDDPANNIWSWTSFSHNSIGMNGQPLLGVGISYSQGVGTPSAVAAPGSNILYEGMSLTFSVTFSFVCNCPNLPVIGQIPPITRNYTSTCGFWDANPNHQ